MLFYSFDVCSHRFSAEPEKYWALWWVTPPKPKGRDEHRQYPKGMEGSGHLIMPISGITSSEDSIMKEIQLKPYINKIK